MIASVPLILTPENFEQTTQDVKPTFVKFYAPWCGHCKKMKPDWDKLASVMDSGKITIADVDCTESGKDICSSENVQGFPTLKIFENGVSENYDESDRSFESLKKFAIEYISNKCSISDTKSCSTKQLKYINKYKNKKNFEKKNRIEEITDELKDVDKYMEEFVKKLESQYNKAEKENKEKKKDLNLEKKILKTMLNENKEEL